MSIFDFFKINNYKSKIESLSSELDLLKSNNKELINELAQSNSTIKDLTTCISEKEQVIKSIAPFYNLDFLNISDSFDRYQKIWMEWGLEIHQSLPQLERQKRACNNILTPLKLDVENGTGYFRGKESDYLTSLLYCECKDFQHRLRPCKHMYRLAYEFDVYMLDDVQIHPDIQNLLRMIDIEQDLKVLSHSQLELLRDVLISDGLFIENRSSAKTLLAKKLIQISTDKSKLLNTYTKDQLLSMIPANTNLKVSTNTKKSDVVNIIISNFPNVIENIEKITIYAEAHQTIQHLVKDILTSYH